ncbi:MAG TPA: universal stress protein [Terriglobales bacterium]|nr:universal stress protein [Terriglobales bacterium]
MTTLEVVKRVALNKILFATDFSPCSNAAMAYAVAIANQYGAKLYAAHVLSPDSYLFATPETLPSLIDQAEEQKQLDAALLEEQLRGVPHQVLSPVGDIADVLFRLVREHAIDLLVLGTHGRSGLSRLVMGSVAEKIFRQAPCPVLTVGPCASAGQGAVAGFKHILFATSFSDESLAAAHYAISLAQENQAHLTFLNVLERSAAGTVDFDANADFILNRLREMVPPEAELWCQPQFIVEFGAVEQQILNVAEAQGADLIVLGIHAPQAPVTAATHLGHSKAQRIVALATCPVLTVRG